MGLAGRTTLLEPVRSEAAGLPKEEPENAAEIAAG
jgi:hypothetical protein